MDYQKLIRCLEEGIDAELLVELKRGRELPVSRLVQIRAENPALPWRELLSHFELQKRAESKFSRRAEMIFTAKGLEQSSSEELGIYHGSQIKEGQQVADLCCGIGGDLFWIAERAGKVAAVDIDEASLMCAGYNCRSHSNIEYLKIPAETFRQQVDLIFADPDRRAGSRRRLKAEEMEPSLQELLDLQASHKLCSGMLIKLAPAIDYRQVSEEYFGEFGLYPGLEHSWEFISERGTLKEALLRTGNLAQDEDRRAVLLPEQLRLGGSGKENCGESGWQEYIFEPDSSIIRSGLVQKLGNELGYGLVDRHLALLSGAEKVSSPWGRSYRLKEHFPYNQKRIQHYLRRAQAGELVIKTRGFPASTESLRKRFKLQGNRRIILLIVRRGKGHDVAVLEASK